MEKKTQRNTNPFKYSDTNKRYHTFDYYMRSLFGEKCAKISLDAGFICPNIDGRCSTGGCIYCFDGSRGAVGETLSEQYSKGRDIMEKKWGCKLFIPYLQAHTNTYAPTEVLRQVYDTAASFDGAVMLAVATRADCLSDEVMSLLAETSKKIPLLVELGLQSIHDKTAEKINRGHTFKTFCQGYEKLRSAGGDIRVGVHLINGLPDESEEEMLESALVVGDMHPDMVKLHLLHVIKGTPLGAMWNMGQYTPLELEDYVRIVCDQLEVLPPDVAIGRVTGDGAASSLLAPLWSIKKTIVANEIDKELFKRNSWQGKRLEKR